jgi:hypothetical protein
VLVSVTNPAKAASFLRAMKPFEQGGCVMTSLTNIGASKGLATPTRLVDIKSLTPNHDAVIGSSVVNGCVQFTNFGRTTYITIWNTCSKPVLATVVSYNITGTPFLTRFFHLMDNEQRNILVQGYSEIITNEGPWSSTLEDGSPFIQLIKSSHDNGFELWRGSNINGQYNALTYRVFINGVEQTTAPYAQTIFAPGEIQNLFDFFPGENGNIIIAWASLDPH